MEVPSPDRGGRLDMGLINPSPRKYVLVRKTENRHWTPYGLCDPHRSFIQAQFCCTKKDCGNYAEKRVRTAFAAALRSLL